MINAQSCNKQPFCCCHTNLLSIGVFVALYNLIYPLIHIAKWWWLNMVNGGGRRCIWEKLTSSYYVQCWLSSFFAHAHPLYWRDPMKREQRVQPFINFMGDSSSLAGYIVITTFIIAMCTTAPLNKQYPIAFMYTIVGHIASYFYT